MDGDRNIHPRKNKESGCAADSIRKMDDCLCFKQWNGREKRWNCLYEQCNDKESCPVRSPGSAPEIQQASSPQNICFG